MDIRKRDKIVILFIFICLGVLIIFQDVAFTQKRDEREPANLPSVPSTSSVPNQPNIPRPPSVPQLPTLPQTTIPQTLPSLPRLPTIPDTMGMPQTTIFSGEYSRVETDESGERIVFVKNAMGEEIKFLLAADSKVFKGDSAISIDEIKNNEAVVVHYETKNTEGVGRENILKSIFVVVEETSAPKDEVAPEEKTDKQKDLILEEPLPEEIQR